MLQRLIISCKWHLLQVFNIMALQDDHTALLGSWEDGHVTPAHFFTHAKRNEGLFLTIIVLDSYIASMEW